jgi:hypothetical protein
MRDEENRLLPSITHLASSRGGMLSFVIWTSWLSLQQNMRSISCEAGAIGVLENVPPSKEGGLALFLQFFCFIAIYSSTATRFGFSCVI